MDNNDEIKNTTEEEVLGAEEIVTAEEAAGSEEGLSTPEENPLAQDVPEDAEANTADAVDLAA